MLIHAALAATLALSDAAPGVPPAPTFTTPTRVDHALVAFTPGSTQILMGRHDRSRASVVVRHLQETRVFVWQGAPLETVVFEEQEFENGLLVEVARTYLAQADDGTVYLFGEVSETFDEQGGPEGPENDSWVVGPPGAEDPPGLQQASAPAVFMPADVSIGRVFDRSALPDQPEIVEVVAVRKLRVPAGRFRDVVVMKERASDAEPGPPGFSWYAAGVGRLAEKGPGLRVRLMASSLQPAD